MEPAFALPITAITAVLTGALLIAMTLGIALHRKRHLISYGDGDDGRFAKRRRGHINASEQIPISLILLALAEGMAAPAAIVLAIATLLTLGRYTHALHFWIKGIPFVFRLIGIVLTTLSQLLAIGAIVGLLVF